MRSKRSKRDEPRKSKQSRRRRELLSDGDLFVAAAESSADEDAQDALVDHNEEVDDVEQDDGEDDGAQEADDPLESTEQLVQPDLDNDPWNGDADITTEPQQEVTMDEKKVREALHHSVHKICYGLANEQKKKISKAFVHGLNILVASMLERLGSDIHAFAKHAKRKTITTDDILLLARNNPSLKMKLEEYMQQIQRPGKAPNRGRSIAAVSHSSSSAVHSTVERTGRARETTNNVANISPRRSGTGAYDNDRENELVGIDGINEHERDTTDELAN